MRRLRSFLAASSRFAHVSTRARAMPLAGIGALLLLGAVVALGLGVGSDSAPSAVTLPYGQFLMRVNAGNVQSITLDLQTDDLTGTLNAPVTYAGQTSRQVRSILYPQTPDAAFYQAMAARHVRIMPPAPESGGARLTEALIALLGVAGGVLLVVGLRRPRGASPRSDGSPHLL